MMKKILVLSLSVMALASTASAKEIKWTCLVGKSVAKFDMVRADPSAATVTLAGTRPGKKVGTVVAFSNQLEVVDGTFTLHLNKDNGLVKAEFNRRTGLGLVVGIPSATDRSAYPLNCERL